MNRKHGDSAERTYSIWKGIKQRCLNPNIKGYKDYGGRGIKICNDWLSYEKFREWALSSGYEDSLQIDRIDNDGDYSPENCRWATPSENCRHTRRSHYITINGITKCLAEWCEQFGILQDTARKFIKRNGEKEFVKFYLEEKFFEKKHEEKTAMDDTPNKSYKVSEVAEKLGCSQDNVYRMIKYGNLEAFRIGGKAKYRVTDHALNDFIERMKVRNEELAHG